jgi:hypothetical protein
MMTQIYNKDFEMQYSVSNINGYWLVNGKKVSECDPTEVAFFEEFMRRVKG